MKVYTLGYAQAGAQQRLEELMQDPSMILVDTRMSPRTKFAPWDCMQLKERWSERYRWGGKVLGNENYKGGPIKIADPLTGLNRLLDWLQRGYSLVLLCGCKNYDTCHRSHIVKLLEDGLAVHPSLDVQIMPETSVASMKCFSIRPPYAEWIVWRDRFVAAGLPPKIHENREYPTKYRGPILIHSSKKFEEDAFAAWSRRIPGLAQAVPESEDGYAHGMIVGIADLVEVVEESDDPWFVGSYGWVFENARSLKVPIPYRGSLQMFDVALSVIQNVLPERSEVLA